MIVGATDTHMHIYQPGYPLTPVGNADAESAAGLADYRTEMARLGLSRTVIVQPSAYGTDHRCTLAAMAALGEAARGVAILPEDVSVAEITRLDGLGMRGLMDIPAGMMDWDRTQRMAP
jgi:D-galactarolactone isomerase